MWRRRRIEHDDDENHEVPVPVMLSGGNDGAAL
jgi:hypothetical protein